jgi:TRAP-type C4-dicarboxylate transport system substrate-binding protein
MKTRNRMFVMSIVIMLAVFASYPGLDAATPQNVIKIKLAGSAPLEHSATKALYIYKKYVEERSGGRIFVEVYPAQQLFNDKDLPTVLPKGAVDICQTTADMWTGLSPSIGFLAIPFIFDNDDHFWRFANGKARNLIQEDLQKGHIRLLCYLDNGQIGIMFKEPVATLEDLKGRRMRSLGRITGYFAQSLGMAPTTMSSGEVYTALQRGTIDGLFSGVTSLDLRRFYEVAKYAFDDADYMPKAPIQNFMMNLKFFNSQPQDIQKILLDGGTEVEKYTRVVAKELDNNSRQVLVKNGVKLLKISDDEIARWKKISIPFMMSKFKEDVDPKKVDLMISYLEEERKQMQKSTSDGKKK